MKYCYLFIAFYLLISVSCKKDDFYSGMDASLSFSNDTILFDTIFSGMGTSTKRLMVYNHYDKALRISDIRLAKGDNSPYTININGAEKEAKDVIIEPNDSMYVFVQILAPKTEIDLPLIMKDSILFTTNGQQQDIKLISYAQDVFILKDSVIQTQTWSGKKPYLIYGNLIVDSANTLYINPGVTIYMHRNSNIIIKGNIQASGSYYEPIVFRHDRFEKLYDDIPGQWGGIYIIPGSGDNKLDWVTIKNGTTGLQLGDIEYNLPINMDLYNVTIRNMSYACLIAYRATIYGTNCLIADARNYTCLFTAGGSYQFYQSTFANYYSWCDNRENNIPTVTVSNYLTKVNTTNQYDLFDLNNSFFRNCIIYGFFSNELKLDFKSGVNTEITFNHCLIRKENVNEYNSYSNSVIWNKDPKFLTYRKLDEYDYYTFNLDTLSPAKDAGALEWGTIVPYDLNNNSRMNDNAPDLGAFERKEK